MPSGNEITACYVFLYGSLRAGAGNPHTTIICSRGERVEEGRMPGQLYRVNQQYAALYDPSSGDTVVGDIVRFPEDLAGEILEGLDRYEGIAPGLPTPPPFKREVVRVQCPDGNWLDCWAWLCNHSVAGCSQIRHGDALSRA